MALSLDNFILGLQVFYKIIYQVVIYFLIILNSNSLESSNQFERAACLAVLTDNYEQALETLDNAHNSGKKTYVNMVS